MVPDKVPGVAVEAAAELVSVDGGLLGSVDAEGVMDDAVAATLEDTGYPEPWFVPGIREELEPELVGRTLELRATLDPEPVPLSTATELILAVDEVPGGTAEVV